MKASSVLGPDSDLVVGDCILAKVAQDPKLRIEYKDRFELD